MVVLLGVVNSLTPITLCKLLSSTRPVENLAVDAAMPVALVRHRLEKRRTPRPRLAQYQNHFPGLANPLKARQNRLFLSLPPPKKLQHGRKHMTHAQKRPGKSLDIVGVSIQAPHVQILPANANVLWTDAGVALADEVAAQHALEVKGVLTLVLVGLVLCLVLVVAVEAVVDAGDAGAARDARDFALEAGKV